MENMVDFFGHSRLLVSRHFKHTSTAAVCFRPYGSLRASPSAAACLEVTWVVLVLVSPLTSGRRPQVVGGWITMVVLLPACALRSKFLNSSPPLFPRPTTYACQRIWDRWYQDLIHTPFPRMAFLALQLTRSWAGVDRGDGTGTTPAYHPGSWEEAATNYPPIPVAADASLLLVAAIPLFGAMRKEYVDGIYVRYILTTAVNRATTCTVVCH
ncbi:hypothetical protein L209DRAFT_332229 [Thermothelomyces heterothallicus CBS 203.75]